MKAITETDVREQLVRIEPEQFVVPRGRILTPAARDFLNMRKIRIVLEGQTVSRPQSYRARDPELPRPASAGPAAASAAPEPPAAPAAPARAGGPDPAPKARYRDYVTGAPYADKPEYMTQLCGNLLVRKDHPRIECRGRMDSLQAQIVRVQADMAQRGEQAAVIADLQDVLGVLREIMRCDVLDEPFVNERIIGLDHAELRDHSHHPQKYYKIRQMLLTDHTN